MDITDLPEKNEDAWFTCGALDCQNYQLIDEAIDEELIFCNPCYEQIQAEKLADEVEMRREALRDELMERQIDEEEIHLKLADEYDGIVNENDDKDDIQRMRDNAKRKGWDV